MKLLRIQMKNMNMKFAVILIMVAIMAIFAGCDNSKAAEEELNSFQSSGCGGLFVSMYDISGYDENMFSEYMGIPTYICRNYQPSNAKKMTEFLTNVNNQTENSYYYLLLGLDPAKFSGDEEELKAFKDAVPSHPMNKVEIILPIYPYDYWNSLNEKKYTALKEKYQMVVDAFGDMDNVYIYFAGDKLWLLSNANCYMKDTNYGLKDSVCNDYVLIETIFTHNSLISGIDLLDKWSHMDELMQTIREENLLNKTKLSKDKSYVFIGDSVFGLFGDPTSIPSVVQEYSGVPCYNCGIGGMAIVSTNETPGCVSLIDAVTDSSESSRSMKERLLSDYVSEPNRDSFTEGCNVCQENTKDITFFVEFGVNDYFTASDLNTAHEEFEKGIRSLQTRYPESEIVVLVPGYIVTPNYGIGENPTDISGGNLEDYRKLIREIGNDCGCDVVEMTEFPFLTQESCPDYSDGVHYNEMGRFLIGIELVRHLEEKNGTL